jgi:hypothetical protein
LLSGRIYSAAEEADANAPNAGSGERANLSVEKARATIEQLLKASAPERVVAR